MLFRSEDGRLLLCGNVELSDIEEALDIKLEQDDHDTLTGLVFDALGMIPDNGPQDIDLDVEGLHIHVSEIDEHQISRAIVSLLPSPDEDEQENEND